MLFDFILTNRVSLVYFRKQKNISQLGPTFSFVRYRLCINISVVRISARIFSSLSLSALLLKRFASRPTTFFQLFSNLSSSASGWTAFSFFRVRAPPWGAGSGPSIHSMCVIALPRIREFTYTDGSRVCTQVYGGKLERRRLQQPLYLPISRVSR